MLKRQAARWWGFLIILLLGSVFLSVKVPQRAYALNKPANDDYQEGITPTPGPSVTPIVAPVTSTPIPTPNGGMNVRGLIFVENVQNGIKGPNEVVLIGVPLTIDGNKKDGTPVHFTVTSDAGNNGITAGTYKIIQPVVKLRLRLLQVFPSETFFIA